MRYLHHPAISTTTSDEAHASGRRCFYRRTACRSKVDAGVHAHIPVDWVCATAKDGTQPRSFHRLGKNTQDLSIDIDRCFTAAVIRPDDLVDRFTKVQCGKGKFGLTDPLVSVAGFAPKNTHRLATGKFASKIYCAAQHLRHVDRKTSRDACFVQRREDRAFDHCLARERHHFRVWLQHACDKFLTKDRFDPHPIVNCQFHAARISVHL